MRWVPNWWEFLLLFAAAYRIFHLIAEDTLLDRPRKWALHLPRSYDPEQDDPSQFPGYRDYLAKFITCPWCLGFWLSVGWWLGWLIFHKWAVAAAVPWAMSAAVGITAKHLE